jgi:hypothetical protein
MLTGASSGAAGANTPPTDLLTFRASVRGTSTRTTPSLPTWADRAERQGEIERQLVEEGRKRIDELQTALADERRRVDGLYTDLADARTAAMISGSEAAALRTRLEILTDERRRPWWRRWFR